MLPVNPGTQQKVFRNPPNIKMIYHDSRRQLQMDAFLTLCYEDIDKMGFGSTGWVQNTYGFLQATNRQSQRKWMISSSCQ
jgi:hypothetical protein